MGMKSVCCEKCGANTFIDEARGSGFCSYCGNPLSIPRNEYRAEFVYRKIDEARIKEYEYKKEL